MEYETIIGLEVHVQLSTKSKLFCSCSTKYGADANTNVCPHCLGKPGQLPVINKNAIKLAIAAAIMTNSEIADVITFDKKCYDSPDMPAGYQVTQVESPLCKNGWVEISHEDTSGETKKKRITLKQIHIEEDAGRVIHAPDTSSSLIDFNRASVPLIEIVTNPDFRSAAEVVAFMEKLKSLLSFSEVSDCKMQEGSMRCDVNLSIREKGSVKPGTRTEIKNLNSLNAITKAIEFETTRHITAQKGHGEKITSETRRWDSALGETVLMREKDETQGYQIIPHCEIAPIYIDIQWVEEIRTALPESAGEKYERFNKQLGLPPVDCKLITSNKNLAYIFEETLRNINNKKEAATKSTTAPKDTAAPNAPHIPKETANWIIGDLLGICKGINYDDISVDCEKLAKVIVHVKNQTITRATGKILIEKIYTDDIDPDAYIKEKNLGMINNKDILEPIIRDIVINNPKTLADYQNGKTKAYQFFVGQVMKKTAGKADSKLTNELLSKILNNDNEVTKA